MFRKVYRLVMDNSLLLLIGAVVGLVWANLAMSSYMSFLHFDFEFLRNPYFGTMVDNSPLRHLDAHFVINDILMALFFAMAGKEVFESTFPGGALHDPKKAATPLMATLGGIVGPVGIFILGAHLFGYWGPDATTGIDLSHGWAIPTATDIAFSALIARFIFGARHPAVPFLLLLAIADDAIGLIIIALFYTKGDILPFWLLLSLASWAFAFFVLNKKFKIHSLWPYLILFVTSWAGFGLAGLHTSLGFIPIILAMPHAGEDGGLFSKEEHSKDDTLNVFGAKFHVPVEYVLFLFALSNAGVALSAVGFATGLVLASLIFGKLFGIFCFGAFGAKCLKFGLPEGMTYKDLAILGMTAGIGFTVALFVASNAYPEGPIQDAAKMGALLSLLAGVIAIIASKLVHIDRQV